MPMTNKTDTETESPKPPIPAGVDLHDFSFVPVFRSQLFRSTFHARASDAEWRAGFTLWLKSWDQMPAGSLPDDDIELCRLAEFGRDQRGWKKVKQMALHGWYKCDDGRLYHRVVAEGVMAAYMRRRAASDKGKLGASKRWSVIEGGLSNSPTNGAGMQQPLPIDSNRQGEGQGDRENPTPTPPEGGASRRRHSETRRGKDEAVARWRDLIAADGKTDDPRVRKALEAIGGYLRVRMRTTFESPKIEREFCQAYRNATL
jgi:hypothetical protein